ncbi:hypothetical protein BCV71DRAFT_162923, partial [Rhizopus microsporus]
YMKEKNRLSLKSLNIYTMDRGVTGTIELRYKIITEWKAVRVDFQNNCAFI